MDLSPSPTGKKSKKSLRTRVIGKTRNLHFFPDDGVARWVETITIVDPYGDVSTRESIDPRPAGKMTGNRPTVTYKGTTRQISHMAWEYHHREKLPRYARIKHLDGNPWNNRIENLQLVPRGGYQAITRIGGAVVYLGTYPSATDAREAVAAARAAVGLGPVRSRKPVTSGE